MNRLVPRRISTVTRKIVPVVDPRLPSGFRFGTVAAAYQVEGATAEDGKELSRVAVAGHRRRGARPDGKVTRDERQFVGDLLGSEDEIDARRGNGARGHAGELRRMRILRQGDSSMLLDGRDAVGAIGSGAGKNDTHDIATVHFGERLEELVDHSLDAPRPLAFHDTQMTVGYRHRRVRRDDVRVVGFDAHAVDGIDHGYRAGPRQDRGQLTLVRRIEVLNEHVREAAVLAQMAHEPHERLEPARRCADPDDGRAWHLVDVESPWRARGGLASARIGLGVGGAPTAP